MTVATYITVLDTLGNNPEFANGESINNKVFLNKIVFREGQYLKYLLK